MNRVAKYMPGERLEIIPNGEHSEKIKKHYGKLVTVGRIRYAADGNVYYQCKGIPNYARESDLKRPENAAQGK